MGERNARTIAVLGIIGTAALATVLLMPAIRQLGFPTAAWLGLLIMVVPTAALLTATGFLRFGLARSLAVALGVMVLTSIITWVVAVFTFAAALSGSSTGSILGIVLYITPAVSVVVFGLLSLRFVPPRHADLEREHPTANRAR
jgi:Kef-type K+ transport system membrane component KefB